jgi:hypothetical protein
MAGLFCEAGCTRNPGRARARASAGIWEGALITDEIYKSRSRTLKFVPVFLGTNEDWIPEPLRSGTHYALTSESSYQGLYDFLPAQAGVESGAVGPLKAKPRRKGAPLTFDEPLAPKAAKIEISRIIKYPPNQPRPQSRPTMSR